MKERLTKDTLIHEIQQNLYKSLQKLIKKLPINGGPV